MARKPRFNLPGIPQHVIQRFNNREPCTSANLIIIAVSTRCRQPAIGWMAPSTPGADDQPRASAGYARHNPQYTGHEAGAGQALCPLYQRGLPTQRHPVGGALQVLCCGCRAIPAQLLSLY